MDEESQKQKYVQLDNDTVQNLSWAVRSVSVRDVKGKTRKSILSGVEGSINSGQLTATPIHRVKRKRSKLKSRIF